MKRNQTGSVLLVSLVILLVLTVVGIASISGVSMTEKMANSQRDYDTAFELAEAALVAGERWLDDYDPAWDVAHLQDSCSTGVCWKADCSTGYCFNGTYPATAGSLCEVTPPTTPIWETESNWTSYASDYDRTVTGIDKPQYLIEFLCYTAIDPEQEFDGVYDTNWVRIYRVTALGYGADPNTRVMLQSTYRVD